MIKRSVWKNKSNGQLCVTIPKNSKIKEGDLVQLEKSTVKRIAYLGLVGDLFHYGHLHSIKFAHANADFTVCGVFTDKAVEEYRVTPIANLQERKAVVESLTFVDKVMVQHSKDPTENLQKLHQEHPDAEIVLVHGDNWKDVPGEAFVRSIGGSVLKHPYYNRLSTFKIVNQIIENKDKYKDITKFTSYIDRGDGSTEEYKGNRSIISSKADTLKALRPLLTKSRVEQVYDFTISEWKNNKEKVIEDIMNTFTGKVVIRSSAVNEDTEDNSMAGFFESVLHIDASNPEEIEDGITTVLSSYKDKNSESSFNQVLVQTQTEGITMSGVVFTRTLEKNAPYYVINYDDTTGSTDSVTAGKENKMMVISHFAETVPQQMERVVDAVRELEEKIPKIPLDIEFALTETGDVVVFQVRPLAVNMRKEEYDDEIRLALEANKQRLHAFSQRQPHLAGEETLFADMPDWNPAEIIGNTPNHFDYTVYDYVITGSAWHEARASQGYYNVNPAKLVELFGTKPFVNVRNSFNSFTPASLSQALREKLVTFYLTKLRNKPHLQDKVEFDVAYTCYDLGFADRSQELGLTEQEVMELQKALVSLTNNLVSNGLADINKDLEEVCAAEQERVRIQGNTNGVECTPQEYIQYAQQLLDNCRNQGTVQFSRLARLGFIAKILLKSLVKKGVVDQQFYDTLYASITTVATKISDDFKKLVQGEMETDQFLQHYFHLRPGTYDITSLRYDANPQLLQSSSLTFADESVQEFVLDSEIEQKINAVFAEHGLTFDAHYFIAFVKAATEARELAKFEFTKSLSDALELLAEAGERMGFTRKEIAQLDVQDMFSSSSLEQDQITEKWKQTIKEKEQERVVLDKMVLPSVITSPTDFDVVQHYAAKPNFITQKATETHVVNIDSMDSSIPNIEGSIVVLENGDPGYDWIFTRNPAGLITKYGGVASHMSIRCAEFGIPAAIGCGETIYNKIVSAKNVLLDCKNQKVVPK